MDEIEKAIKYYEKRVAVEKEQAAEYKGLGGEFEVSAPLRKSVLERHETALSALRSQQERQKGCKIVYRRRTFGGYKRVVCPECGTEVEIEKPSSGDVPYCGGCGKIVLDAEQTFCGWCGRRLKEAQEDGRA